MLSIVDPRWSATPRHPCARCAGPTGYRQGRAPEGAMCRDCRSASSSITGDPFHGSKRGYRTMKCRCDDCRAWNARQSKAYAARVIEREGVSPTQKARPRRTARRCLACSETLPLNRRDWRYCGSCGPVARGKLNRGAKIPPALRAEIYERDGWKCQICSLPVDPDLDPQDGMAATLDHIEPQSFALIPDNGPANLRLAHRSCNSRRGNRAGATA